VKKIVYCSDFSKKKVLIFGSTNTLNIFWFYQGFVKWRFFRLIGQPGCTATSEYELNIVCGNGIV
jgi:hypothetical protein